MTVACALLVAGTSAACVADRSLMGPSAVIVPDVARISVGSAQTFVVYNAGVREFSAQAVGRAWSECVRLDTAQTGDNSVRVAAIARCPGLVYLTADLGAGRSPLVAAVVIE